MIVTYPDTRIDDVTDTLAGVSFPDPYRWLEHESEEVRRWQHAQAEVASTHVREWPHFKQLRRLVAQFDITPRVVLPRYAAGRWFRTRFPEGASQAQALVSDEPMSEGRVLFDPMTEDSERPPFLSWISPSPDGRTLAVGVCADGSENNTIRLIDVATRQWLADPPPQTLMDNWTGGAHWLPDSSGFFFSAITGAAIDFVQSVYLHRRTPAPTTIPVDIAWTEAKNWRTVVVSRDGQYAVALERLANPIPVAIAALGEGQLQWRPFVTSIAGTVAGHVVGDRYIAVTDIGAPRGRLIAIPLDADDPSDPQSWQELVAESNAALRTVTPVGEALYLTEFVDTYARVRIVDLDGQELGVVPLPGLGAVSELPFPIMNLVPKGHPDQFLFAFSSLTSSWAIYSHTLGQVGIETLKDPQVQLDDTVVEDRWAVSADGTRTPYHLVRRADVSVNHPQPTLIYAYGGFNVPLVPQFPGPTAAFVAAGGVFVHAHLRGGAEFGLPWWQGGRMNNKQNCYSDLYAIAEDLIAAKRCTPQSLAVTGGSNGGLMAGVALTQRPDLWRVVVPRVPMLDLIGACREPYGRMCITMEYANVEDPEEVRRLAGFSAYHLVRDGTSYPAVFIDAGDTDPRCPPWHARKFAARLQRASAGSAPILLHVWENVGHGWATDKNVAVNEHTEWLAFTLRHLGLEWPRGLGDDVR
jgi:prolyl oligopeptidase